MKRIILFLILICLSAISYGQKIEQIKGLRTELDGKLSVINGVPGTNYFMSLDTTEARLAKKANLYQPAFVNPTANTLPVGTNTTGLATTAGVVAEIAAESESVILKDMNAMGLTTVKMIPIYSYHFLSANAAFTDGKEIFIVYRLNKTITLTGFIFTLSTAGNYTPDNYNGISISSISGNTTTLLSSTVNDTADPNMWESGAGVVQTKPLPSPIVLTPGLYSIHFTYNCSGTATTTPSMYTHGSVVSPILGQSVFPVSSKSSTTPSTGVNLSTTTATPTVFAIWGY